MQSTKVAASVRSHVLVHSRSVSWKIDGISRLSPKAGNYVSSGTLGTIDFAEQTVRFELHFYFCNQRGGMSLAVKWFGGEDVDSLMWDLDYLSVGPIAVNLRTPTPRFVKETSWMGNDWADRDWFMKNLVVSDALTVNAKVSAWIPNITNGPPPIASCGHPTSKADAVVADLRKFRASAAGSDVRLKAGFKSQETTELASFPAHRAILAARSPVFARMFYGSDAMQETVPGSEVCLGGIEAPTVDSFLHFIYTGEVSKETCESEDALCHLLSVAHQYEVASLVESCVEVIVPRLTDENAAERLMLADMTGVAKLRAAVLGYICQSPERIAAVQGSEGFQRLSKQRPALLTEILASLFPPKESRKRPAPTSGVPGSLSDKTVAVLKQLCIDRGLPTSGNKQELIDRLQMHESGR